MEYLDSFFTNWEVVLVPNERLRAYLYGPHYGDKRVSNWALMQPGLPILLSILYLVIVGYCTRNPTPPPSKSSSSPMLKYGVVLHNIFLCLLSLYMTIETFLAAYSHFGWDKHFQLFCHPMDSSATEWTSDSELRLATVIHIHYLSKFYEYIDTFIMLYKGNYRQVSFLHVYHHVTTGFPVWWLNMKYNPGGEAWLCCFLNSMVHVFMYAHYALSALHWPRPPKLYVTLFQIIQFGIYLVQSGYLIVTNCYRPMISVWQLFIQSVLFISLFIQFYIKERKEESKKIKEK